MSELALQREILEAGGDPVKLAAIAERHGVNPALWWYFHESMKQVREITAQAAADMAAWKAAANGEDAQATEGKVN